MQLYGVISLIIQVFFAVHAAKTGRYWWIFIIIFFPLVGSLVYFFVEYLPTMQDSPGLRKTESAIKKTLDPTKQIREFEQRLQITDSHKNREDLAGAYCRAGRHQDALELLEPLLDGPYGDDPQLLTGLAHSSFGVGDFEKCIGNISLFEFAEEGKVPAEMRLLKAQCHEGLNDLDAALEEYASFSKTFSGEEARCRHALLLKKLQLDKEAQALFAEIETNCRLANKHYRKAQKRWLDIAITELKEAS